MINYGVLGVIFLLVTLVGDVHAEPSRDVGTQLEEKGKDLAADAVKLGVQYADKFLENLTSRDLFIASADQPGVCLYKGIWPYHFGDCVGKTGDELMDCCSKKNKNNVNRGAMFKYFGTPSWIEENPNFSHVNDFYGVE